MFQASIRFWKDFPRVQIVFTFTTSQSYRLAEVTTLPEPMLNRKDWVLLPAGKSPLHSETARDVGIRLLLLLPSRRELPHALEKYKPPPPTPQPCGHPTSHKKTLWVSTNCVRIVGSDLCGVMRGISWRSRNSHEAQPLLNAVHGFGRQAA
jgi:hypothetical protein